jgi:neutral ceramidase
MKLLGGRHIEQIQLCPRNGQLQYEKAKQLFDSASEALSGSVDYRHTRVDMSCVEIENTYLIYKDNTRGLARTWPAALGLSFAAGSREDGVPEPDIGLEEGITNSNIKVTERLANAVASLAAGLFKLIPTALAFESDIVRGHLPKPILFAVGASEGLAPKILPFQILRIGQLVIAGFPGEITTMAGRRLSYEVLDALQQTDSCPRLDE